MRRMSLSKESRVADDRCGKDVEGRRRLVSRAPEMCTPQEREEENCQGRRLKYQSLKYTSDTSPEEGDVKEECLRSSDIEENSLEERNNCEGRHLWSGGSRKLCSEEEVIDGGALLSIGDSLQEEKLRETQGCVKY